ncbi:MAG: 23S rRNA (guanosine(2251)-2'-O)-methyltransferase RlmB [Thermodesulfovibrionia bacterium]
MYLYGKNSVYERLKADPESIKKVFIQDGFNAPHIMNLIESRKIPYEIVSEERLNRLIHADRLQGIVAKTSNFKYTPFDNLLKDKPTILFLDSINDPHNLGSIMRIAACLGNFGIVIPEHGSCKVNETVIHVASGGENFVPVSMVVNLSQAIREAKDRGYWVAGAVVEGGEEIGNVSLPFPLAIVLGSEGKGLRYGILKHIDLKVTIPMRGVNLSFNVAMACAILCYEITRQRENIGGGRV